VTAASLPDAVDNPDVSMEDNNVSDQDKGRDSNTFTGTTDAVDAETGALGTAGTPVTTGYGVSGSTVGTGTKRKSRKQESGKYRGSTPDSASYDVGGRNTGDDGVLKGSERQAPVSEQYSDASSVEANVPREREGRDVYEQSDGYVEGLDRDTLETASDRGPEASQGTNIAGTEDPKGLGDNTDDN
jgi:hypothetical protein